jgi:glycosyltransferase 2 family protein
LKSRRVFSDLADSQDGKPVKRARWVIVISTALAIFLLYLTLRDLDWQAFFVTLGKTQFIYLPLVMVWSSVSFLIRALRLQVLLTNNQSFSLPMIFWANMAGYLGNNVLPARAGEFIRAAYLARKNKVSTSYVLAAGIVERFMDLIALVILGSLSLSSMEMLSPSLSRALSLLSVLGLMGVAAMVLIPYFQERIGSWLQTLSVLPQPYRIKLLEFFNQFSEGLNSLNGFKRIMQFAGLTCCIWLMDAIGAVFLAYILKIDLLLSQAFVLLAALGLSSAIPSTPGSLGVYQYVAVTTLAPFGIPKADALAYILVSQILGYVIIVFWGILSAMKFNTYNDKPMP